MNPKCSYCLNLIGDDDYFYRVNPEGGYGVREVLICEDCLEKEPVVKQRLVDCGVILSGISIANLRPVVLVARTSFHSAKF